MWNVFAAGRYLGSMTALLAFQSTPVQDTVVSIAARDGYDFLEAVAAGSVAAAFVAVLFLIAFGVLQTRRATRAIERARQGFSADPAVASIRRTASNVESISKALNEEVAKLSESVSRLSDRLSQASDRMEERIEEFNAFMEIVQREAEGVFVEGAATARGVRAGLGNLGEQISVTPDQGKSPAQTDAEDFEGDEAAPPEIQS